MLLYNVLRGIDSCSFDCGLGSSMLTSFADLWACCIHRMAAATVTKNQISKTRLSHVEPDTHIHVGKKHDLTTCYCKQTYHGPHRSLNDRRVCLRCAVVVNGVNNLAQEVQLLEHGVLSNSSTSTSVLHCAGGGLHLKSTSRCKALCCAHLFKGFHCTEDQHRNTAELRKSELWNRRQ